MFKRSLVVSTAALLIACPGLAVAQSDKEKPGAPATKQPSKRADPSADKGKKLEVGDAAPSLQIERWVKGEPVTGFEKGRVYVIEFWAPWCGPCIASMPHLTELQDKHKDQVTIISVSSADSRGNSLDKVEAMVKEKGDGMGYTVAWDTKRVTNDRYMAASGQDGIPCAFIVDHEGKLAWIGHPKRMDGKLDEVVKKASGKKPEDRPADSGKGKKDDGKK